MEKKTIISQCSDCPLRFYIGNDLHCGHSKFKYGTMKVEELTIPDSCPLEEASEEKGGKTSSRGNQRDFKMG